MGVLIPLPPNTITINRADATATATASARVGVVATTASHTTDIASTATLARPLAAAAVTISITVTAPPPRPIKAGGKELVLNARLLLLLLRHEPGRLAGWGRGEGRKREKSLRRGGRGGAVAVPPIVAVGVGC